MDIAELFEYPLPHLQTNLEKIAIETSGGFEGSFIIKNGGGGQLEGRILSNSKAILFSPEEFSGRSITVFYTLYLDIYKPGDVIKTSAVIMSNGGEKTIPVIIKVTPHAIDTREGEKITSLKDFYFYAKKHNVSARLLFMSQEFMMWLYAIGHERMDAFETFLKDPNKERAVDNFLTLNRLKKKTVLIVPEKKLRLTVKPNGGGVVSGKIAVKKSSWGYLEASISNKSNVEWLTLDKKKLTSADFDKNDMAEVTYNINPGLMRDSYDVAEIAFDEFPGETVCIHVKKQPEFSVVLSKESFDTEDVGKVIINNNTGVDLMVEILPLDNFVKFEGKRYLISGYAEIPFSLKLTAFFTAQMSLKRQPTLASEIEIHVNSEKFRFRKRLAFDVGRLY